MEKLSNTYKLLQQQLELVSLCVQTQDKEVILKSRQIILVLLDNILDELHPLAKEELKELPKKDIKSK